jgi:hypothetical protein
VLDDVVDPLRILALPRLPAKVLLQEIGKIALQLLPELGVIVHPGRRSLKPYALIENKYLSGNGGGQNACQQKKNGFADFKPGVHFLSCPFGPGETEALPRSRFSHSAMQASLCSSGWSPAIRRLVPPPCPASFRGCPQLRSPSPLPAKGSTMLKRLQAFVTGAPAPCTACPAEPGSVTPHNHHVLVRLAVPTGTAADGATADAWWPERVDE